MKLDFDIEGVEETVRALKKLDNPKETRKILLSSMRMGATPIVKEARSNIDTIKNKDGAPRKDLVELKKFIKKRTGKSKRFPTIIVGFALPKEGGLKWYQRLVEKGTKSGNIKAFAPFLRAAESKEKEALNKSLAALKKKFNQRAKRAGFRTI